MNNLIKELEKERTSIVNKCISEGFSEEEKQFIRDEKKCNKITDDGYCEAYAFPSLKWRIGRCPLSSNYDPELSPIKEKKRVGQQKTKRNKW